MNEDVSIFLQKAFECLADAQALLEKERFTATVSRSYYAMFHAAQAALLLEKIEAYTHMGVNVQFQKSFIEFPPRSLFPPQRHKVSKFH
jgi:uncharacterized protein (UPF0332 family)